VIKIDVIGHKINLDEVLLLQLLKTDEKQSSGGQDARAPALVMDDHAPGR